MKTKTLALILGVLAVLAPVTYALAVSNSSGSSRSSSSYGRMGGMMDDTYTNNREDIEDRDWWDEMKNRMEDYWNEVKDEEWFDEMEEHMGGPWNNQDNEGDNNSRSGRGGCH